MMNINITKGKVDLPRKYPVTLQFIIDEVGRQINLKDAR